MTVSARIALPLMLSLPALTSAREPIDLPSEVADGFYVTLNDVRANSAKVFEALAGPSGGPISERHFVQNQLPDDVGPEAPDRELLQSLFSVLDANGDGQLTRAEWNERIESDLTFVDANEDGRITLRELSSARENVGIGDAIDMVF